MPADSCTRLRPRPGGAVKGLHLATVLLAATLIGCASTQEPAARTAEASTQEPVAAPQACPAGLPDADAPDDGGEALVLDAGQEAQDPWHRFNRAVYRFNARFDDAIHYPVARQYRRVVPRELRSRVGNFFENLGEIRNIPNHLLQGRLRFAARSTGRLVVNSTIGIGGLFDVADRWFALEHSPTGFGDTLGRWGFDAGPYLVLPILGPSSLRDGLGQGGDLALNQIVNPFDLYSGTSAIALNTLFAVDTRARLAFRYYQTGSPFEYELVRFLHTNRRAIEIHGLRHRRVPLLPEPDEPESGADDCAVPMDGESTGMLPGV